MAGNFISWGFDTLTPGMAQFLAKLEAAVWAAVNYESDRCQSFAKANAPWIDRTSNARNTLTAQAFKEPTKFTIVVYHQMPYGVWLEVRWGGKYGILLKTIETGGPELMSMIRDIIGRMT